MIPFPCLEMPQAPRGCSRYHATARPLWEGVRSDSEAYLFSQGDSEKRAPFFPCAVGSKKDKQASQDVACSPRPARRKKGSWCLSPAITGKSQSSRSDPFSRCSTPVRETPCEAPVRWRGRRCPTRSGKRPIVTAANPYRQPCPACGGQAAALTFPSRRPV